METVEKEGRQCNRCLNYLPLSRFRTYQSGRRRRRVCRGCENASRRMSAKPADEDRLTRQRDRRILETYGITAEERDKMITDRGGLCDICGQPEKRKRGGKVLPLCVDHVAGTKTIRGMLCSRCNVAIGMMDHDSERVSKALSYLRKER